ncbi:high mobility group B protein 15-like [Aristolochia californica]|uniref:high mobility group B protein 15-like n=1 Tax=Aristolochia californica TaxID=171875 RepID=UPI0035E32058
MSVHISGNTNVPTPADPSGKVSGSASSYPSPVARYEEIVGDSDMFMATLENLHMAKGTKFMIPTIGGKALDLHRLFVEVTSRGGLEQVIRDRKWRDVVALFSFPSTITNASFVLRKYYISLLHDYEQIYFFREQRWQMSTGSSVSASVQGQIQVAAPPILDNDTSGNQLTVGSLLTGTIKGKFDNGYLVSVSHGSEMLQGILYHASAGLPVSSRSVSSVLPRRSIRRRSRRALRDPSHPKSNRSGYNFFFAEHYAKLKPFYHGEETAITQKIGHLWSTLTEAEREVYQAKGVKDKERYQIEMLEYRKSSIASKPR